MLNTNTTHSFRCLKEKTSVDISKGVYAVKEYEYDKFNNVTKVKDYGTGNTVCCYNFRI